MVPLLNVALDFSQKLFTRAVLAILEVENSKEFLGTSTTTMVGSPQILNFLALQYKIGGYGTVKVFKFTARGRSIYFLVWFFLS